MGPGGLSFEEIKKSFEAGKVPAYRPGYAPQLSPAAPPVKPPEPTKSNAQRFEDFFRSFEAEMNQRAEADKIAEAAAQKQQKAAAAWNQAFATFRPALAAMPFIGPALREPGLEFERVPGANVIDMAKRVKDEIDPIREVMRQKAIYDQAVDFGLLTKREAEFAHNRDIREAAERLGVGGETRLASAANEGTVEAARLIAQFNAGMSQTRTDDLLAMIEAHVRAIVGVAGRVEEAPAPRPAAITP